MPHVTTTDGVELYYEETGSGTPIIFVHEFGGDYRHWEPQMRFFSRSIILFFAINLIYCSNIKFFIDKIKILIDFITN